MTCGTKFSKKKSKYFKMLSAQNFTKHAIKALVRAFAVCQCRLSNALHQKSRDNVFDLAQCLINCHS